jgi:hypothetical protein
MVPLGIFLIALVVWTGFLRTVYLEPEQRRSLAELMQTGKPFFNRLVVLCILCAAVMMIYIFSTNRIPYYIRYPLIKLLLAKLILLIPAIIIVTDCSISKSFSIMWKTKLLQAKPLVIFYVISSIVLPALTMLLFPNIWREHSSMNWGDAIRILYHVALKIMGLMVSVMAIRFVGSLEMTELLTADSAE